jgi:hypothetical protein
MDEELTKLIKGIITDQGIKVSGNGIIINNLTDILKTLDTKIDKKLYFLEQRQTRMEEQNKEIIALLKAKA